MKNSSVKWSYSPIGYCLHLQIQPTAEESALIKRTFAILANAALAQPQVIVHRDFHSRNLMKLDGEHRTRCD